MLDPETILVLQGFGYGIAQNLIASIIVEGKKLKDDGKALESAALLERHEHSDTRYVLEQLFSPLVVHTTPEHSELKTVARNCITKHHSYHYLGFALTQWKLFDKERPRRVKPLLYVYRALLTGIHLMRTGKVEANLMTLNEEFRLPYIRDLVARKLAGPEKSELDDVDTAFHEHEYQRLRGVLQTSHDAIGLPELPDERTRATLNDLLVRVRTKGLATVV